MSAQAYLLVNFGGPRSLKEIEPFLCALLTDKDVVRTKWPQFFHNYLFSKIAKKRARRVRKDYLSIGGKSPIYADTEWIASTLEERLNAPVFTFHRYLPATHLATIEALEASDCENIHVFPMFPQFTFATTGSIARFLMKHLSSKTVAKLRWLRSYPSHAAFIELLQKMIREFLEAKNLKEEEIFFLFSAHGVPKSFVETGDPYQYECEASFQKVMALFPNAVGRLAYQSKFGPEEWLRPYTQELCETIENYNEGREHVIFIPISFTSDHIETLFEIEKLYLPILTKKGLNAYRLPALNRRQDWVETIEQIIKDYCPVSTQMLVRKF